FDSTALIGFRKLKEKNFESNLTKDGKGYFVPHNGKRATGKLNDNSVSTFESIAMPHLQSMRIELSGAKKINCIILKENLISGQHCISFTIRLMNEKHESIKEIRGTTIGHKRMLTFPATEASIISLSIDEQKSTTNISEIEAYLIDENLIEK
ncbi:MAG: hypothetical protein ABJA90_12410, partial [Ginsengibacter sp.]